VFVCPGAEKSRQGSTTRKTQNKSSKISEKAARKTGKNEETLTNISFVF